MGRHARRTPRWRFAGGGVAAVALICVALLADHVGSAIGGAAAAADRRPSSAGSAALNGKEGVTARDVDLTSARTDLRLRLRPGRSTAFRVAVVDRGATGSPSTTLARQDADLVVAWRPAARDLPTDGWTGRRAAGAGIAWRDDDWRLVHAGVVLCHRPGGTARVLLVRLANRSSQRWVWVAALPDGGSARLVTRELTDRLRPQRTPYVVVSPTRTAIAGEGFRTTRMTRVSGTLRVAQVRVPAS